MLDDRLRINRHVPWEKRRKSREAFALQSDTNGLISRINKLLMYLRVTGHYTFILIIFVTFTLFLTLCFIQLKLISGFMNKIRLTV